MSESGELVGRPDSSMLESADAADAIRERAHKVEGQMVDLAAKIRTGGILFARYVHEYLDDRLWEVLGYDSPREGLAHPGIEVGYSQAKKLAAVYRTFVVERDVPLDELKGVDPDKLDIAVPALKAGDVRWQDAVSHARELTRSDMRRRYRQKGGPNARLDASQEPELVRCEACGSWVEPDRLEAT